MARSLKKVCSRPILVTGSHRSGSTWAGEMLALSKSVAYVHEPFNVTDEISINPDQFKLWFQYVCDDNAGDTEIIIRNILEYKYPLLSNLKKCRSARHLAKLCRDQMLSVGHSVHSRRALLKDPIALFSAEWLAETFDMDVLIMVRHPAAFCSSLKIKNWHHDFNHFLKQPALMSRYLDSYHDDISAAAANKLSVIDQAILLWNCVHHTIKQYKSEHSSWIFARHEDLSMSPIFGFEEIYSQFNIPFDDAIKEAILNRTGDHNPAEQVERNEFVRNSKASVKNWKLRLSSEEIDHVKKYTSEVAAHLYDDSDW